MSQPIIEVRNLTKRYHLGAIGATSLREEFNRYWDRLRGVPHPDKQDFWALRDVSFDVQPGEVVGVIGRNGAGKSTLLKILSRITEPTSGTATLRGRVASLLEVGTGFHPELTGRENVFLNGAILGMTRAEVRKKFDEIVAFSEVEQFIDTPVKRYSSGMYVRLAFAVAAHLEPEILIVDEVLAVGDAQFQKKCIGKMQDVSRGEGRTVLFVSHNLKAVEHFCTRALMLEAGGLEANGQTGWVISEYLRRGAARLPGAVVEALSDELDLQSLEITPHTIHARDPFAFSLIFRVKRESQISDLHLFFCDSFGERVAIIDLRDAAVAGGGRQLPSGQTVRFVGSVARVALVDGLYRVGLCVRTPRHFLARPDLVELNISVDSATGNLMPYAPEYRGTTLLDYQFDVQIT